MDRFQDDHLINLIYDAALDPDQWYQVIDELRTTFHSITAGFFIQTASQKLGGHYFAGIDPVEMEVYGEGYAANNPWFTTPGLMKPGRVLTDQSLEKLYSDRRHFIRTEMYRGWCQPLNFRHAMGGSLVDMDGALLSFTFFRPGHVGYYSIEEQSRYQQLSRHLMKASKLALEYENLKRQARLSQDTLNRLKLGIVFLTNDRRIEWANDYAHGLLNDSESLSICKGRLTARSAKTQQEINHKIECAERSLQSSYLKCERGKGSPLQITVIPKSHRTSLFSRINPGPVLMIVDPDDHAADNDQRFALVWGLTPLESRFAMQLLQGKSVSEAGDYLGLTKDTARWYSKQIMRKVGVNKQTELCLKFARELTISL